MDDPLRLMCVLAHPDDESMGTGGILAKYAAEGVATTVVCATRGQRGWTGDPAAYPGTEKLGRIREEELSAAANVLGIARVELLDYVDGELDRADPTAVIAAIARLLREIRPQVVVTFAADGAYGHPDHIAISQFTTAATVAAADPDYAPAAGLMPHRVSKLYYYVVTQALASIYLASFGPIAIPIDGVKRSEVVWPDWAVTTHIDCGDHWRVVWEAVSCHASQLPTFETLSRLPDERHRSLWGLQAYYRVFSLVNGGRETEDDLFAGLR